jgi:hypothetical protein
VESGVDGVLTATDFAVIPYSQMDLFIDDINKPTLFPIPSQGSTDTVMLLYSSIIKLKAFHAYLDYRKSCGQALNPDHYAVRNNITKWAGRMDDLSRYTKRCDSKPSNVPDKLTSLKHFKTFKELFVTYLRQFRSVAAGTPLSYIVRKHSTVNTEQRTATYQTINDDLIATASHTTPSYRIDNEIVFDLLKLLVINGEGCAYILKFNITRDGRKVWDALELQAEGPVAITTRKAEAYTSIEKASFSGMSRKFTFDMYVSAHLLGHNELSLLGEPVSESKKVTDFLAGITVPSLSTAKENVIGCVAKLENSMHANNS